MTAFIKMCGKKKKKHIKLSRNSKKKKVVLFEILV